MLLIVDPVPEFTLTGILADEVKTYSLNDVWRRWLVLCFCSADFTFVYPAKVIGFNGHRKEGDFSAL